MRILAVLGLLALIAASATPAVAEAESPLFGGQAVKPATVDITGAVGQAPKTSKISANICGTKPCDDSRNKAKSVIEISATP